MLLLMYHCSRRFRAAKEASELKDKKAKFIKDARGE